ncbi:MAG: hypothetical protein DRJ97_02030 [Thermoprotei archaeon]|nr:MAG: hypothetical protein DRJ97_02030 [Thermoprotei archaeon]
MVRGRVKVYEVYDERRLEALSFIVERLRSQGYVTSMEVSRTLGLSLERVRELLAVLRKAGVICESETFTPSFLEAAVRS